jgi:hypothetical protein
VLGVLVADAVPDDRGPVFRVLDAVGNPIQRFGDHQGSPEPGERVEHHVARFGELAEKVPDVRLGGPHVVLERRRNLGLLFVVEGQERLHGRPSSGSVISVGDWRQPNSPTSISGRRSE